MSDQQQQQQQQYSRLALVGLVLLTGLWWLCCSGTTVFSTEVMDSLCTPSSVGVTTSFRDMRWVELTAFQLLAGVVLSVTWLVVTRQRVWPVLVAWEHRWAILSASLGHLVGNLCTNAALSLLPPTTVHLIKMCEPIPFFVLTLFLHKPANSNMLSWLVTFAAMLVAVFVFLWEDSSFNWWGAAAAFVSGAAFPVRHLLLKDLDKTSWDSPAMQKFSLVSVWGLVLLLPVWFVQAVLVSGIPSTRLFDSGFSSALHSLYNSFSVLVLEGVAPTTHAVLNVSKRLVVVLFNKFLFHITFTTPMYVGMFVLTVGAILSLVQLKSFSVTKTLGLKTFFLGLSLVYTLVGTGLLSGSGGITFTRLSSQFDVNLEPLHTSDGECTLQNRISVAWLYDREIPESVIGNINATRALNPDVPVYVYCGSSHCVNTLKSRLRDVTVEFAVMSDIVQGLALEEWLARHPINKILAGRSFETNLQDAAMLGLLFSHGGFYVSPTVRIKERLTVPLCKKGLRARVSFDLSSEYLFDVAYLTPGHPFLKNLAHFFVSSYPTQGKSCVPFKFDIRRKVWEALDDCPLCPQPADMRLERLGEVSEPPERHFGTLSYNARIRITRLPNIGDEIQGFPGIQFLPYLDTFVERDTLGDYGHGGNITLFFNAWWGSPYAQWPPTPNVHPIMLSVHIGSGMADSWARHVGYLRGKQPIGCRDTNTLEFLHKRDIKAFFSACMTLLIRTPNVARRRGNDIYIVDLHQGLEEILPLEIRQRATHVQHSLYDAAETDIVSRFSTAYDFVRMYSEAKLVITQRIHCALPCVAMGTPVLFFNSPEMPGGGGSSHKISSRTAGLTPLFHTLDLYQMNKRQAKDWLGNFSWDNPPPNPDIGMLMRLRASLWNIIRQTPSLYDAGRKFGVVPMSLPILPEGTRAFTFHLVFANASDSFTWRHWRCVESIFYHHPTSEVRVHSNTLPRDAFEVLSESGYSIRVQRYDLETLLRDSPAKDFLQELDTVRKDSLWQVNVEVPLVSLLVLYQEGGVYVDTDMILVRQIDDLGINGMALGSDNSTLSGSFMTFERGHLYLEHVLKLLPGSYDPASLSKPAPLAGAMKQFRSFLDRTFPRTFFHLFDAANVVARCFASTEGADFDKNMHTVKTRAYGVKLYAETSGQINTLKEGTVCSYLLRSFCVLCSNVY